MNKDQILIADDSMFMRRNIKRALNKAGITDILEASNGVEAVELFKVNEPAMCMLDITMPEMSGIDALKEMKKINPDVTVIMCSAIGQESTVMQALSAGAAEFVVKPFKDEKLVEIIENYR